MTKHLSVRETRENFSDVLGLVRDGKETVIVEKKGKPVAVLISPDQWDRVQQQSKERFFAVVDQLRRDNADKDPEEVYRDVTSVVEEVRQERYERENRAAHRD